MCDLCRHQVHSEKNHILSKINKSKNKFKIRKMHILKWRKLRHNVISTTKSVLNKINWKFIQMCIDVRNCLIRKQLSIHIDPIASHIRNALLTHRFCSMRENNDKFIDPPSLLHFQILLYWRQSLKNKRIWTFFKVCKNKQ